MFAFEPRKLGFVEPGHLVVARVRADELGRRPLLFPLRCGWRGLVGLLNELYKPIDDRSRVGSLLVHDFFVLPIKFYESDGQSPDTRQKKLDERLPLLRSVLGYISDTQGFQLICTQARTPNFKVDVALS